MAISNAAQARKRLLAVTAPQPTNKSTALKHPENSSMHDEDSSSVWATNTLHLRAFPHLLSHGVPIFFCRHCLRLVLLPPALAMREASELQKTHNRFYVNIVKENQYFS